MNQLLRIIAVITLFQLSFGCNLINPAEEIPAYINIDTVEVYVSDIDKGSSSHNLDNIWISVGGENLGVYEIPFTVPTLTKGSQLLTIRAGVKLNGITASRFAYPFFEPYLVTIDLQAGEIYTIVPRTTYKKECKFPWMEDFEDAGISFTYSPYSDTVFKNQNLMVRDGRYSGAVYLDTVNAFFEATMPSPIELPLNGSPIIFEFDYLISNPLEVGYYVITDGAAVWTSLVIIKTNEGWKRFYADLGTYVNYEENPDLFKIGFRAEHDQVDRLPTRIIIDNLKLIHF